LIEPQYYVRPIFFILSLALFGPIALCAQTFSVSGAVKDAKNEPIPFANVFLLQVSDSLIIKGVSADEKGSFNIADVPPDTYYIRASYVGNESDLRAISISKNLHIGVLIIAQNVARLDEVVVTTNKPMVERKTDRLIFNVENTVVSQGNSWDILQRTPGVIAMENELQVRNQSATVYINDRKTQLSQQEVRELLENYPAENVKQVEVIYNPPAKYDAEDGPILNIVTSKNISMGYKGNLSSTYTQAISPKYTFGTSHFYKTEKLNLFGSYAFGPRKDVVKVLSETNFRNNTGIFSRWTTDYRKITRAKSHSTQLNLDYEINEKNTFSMATKLSLSPKKNFENLQETEMRGAQYVLDSTFITESSLIEDRDNFAADLVYKHNFETSGSLSVNGHYTHFNYGISQDANSDYFNPEGAFLRSFGFFTNARQKVDIFTAQLDIASSIGSVEYETGLKGSFIDSQSGIDYYNVLDSGRIFNPVLSDDYNYDESVYAAYFSMLKDWKKLSLKLGLRAEFTKSSGTSVILSTINALEYFELFPTFFLLYTINDHHSLSFDYSRKLTRPRYEDLNPFRYFINENNFIEGNPGLVPNFSNNFNLNYTLNKEYFFDFYYRDNGNYISTLSFQDNENLTLRDITQNVLESTSYGFDFNYGKMALPQWHLYLYLSIFHEDETFIALESNNAVVTNSVNGVYVDLSNYFTLSKDGSLKGELGINYLSGFLEGSYKQAETSNLTLGIRKNFWNNRAVASVQVSDLLNKANAKMTSRYLNQDNSYLARPETQYIRFGLTLNFGNFRLGENERDIKTTETGRLKEE